MAPRTGAFLKQRFFEKREGIVKVPFQGLMFKAQVVDLSLPSNQRP